MAARRGGCPPLPASFRYVFWEGVRSGLSVVVAAQQAGVSQRTGFKWVREAGGVSPRISPDPPGALTFADRARIQELVAAGWIPTRIASALGRPTSTITRELERGRDRSGVYIAMIGQARVEANRRRPKARKIDLNLRLRQEVVARLRQRHSPEQISHRLRRDFPDEPEMWVSPETIYQAFYVQGTGNLAQEVGAALRTGRARRKPGVGQREPRTRRGQIPGMINISERPAEANDRVVPGHWEGDLILGAHNASAIGTLVERTTGFLMLLYLPGDHTAATVAAAMQEAVPNIPEILRRSLAWDQGREMALHTAITKATGIPIYFCNPHSPWQRGTNENTNGLLRQYFPKSTDLSVHGPGILDNVAAELNARPRKRLNWATPAEKLEELLSKPPAPTPVPVDQTNVAPTA